MPEGHETTSLEAEQVYKQTEGNQQPEQRLPEINKLSDEKRQVVERLIEIMSSDEVEAGLPEIKTEQIKNLREEVVGKWHAKARQWGDVI